MLAVLVATDPANHLAESATYCRPDDEKRPGLVGLPDFTTSQICPEDGKAAEMVTDAYPDGWYVRVMFDELLDPSVETLTEILDSDGMGTGTFAGSIVDTHPVKLECQTATGTAFVEVDYDGYYSPSGNNVTWPLGPSLVIKPNDPTLIATSKQCQVTLNDNITDKDGNPIPADQRGPYKFQTAAISVIATDPADSGDADKPALVDALAPYFDNFYWQFNTDVDVTSFCDDADDPAADEGAGLCDGGTEAFQLTPPPAFGICNVSGDVCETNADCTAPDTHCDTSYVYTYSGLDIDDEIGLGYIAPLETEKAYTFSLKAGAKLKDRCGNETTVAMPDPKNGFAIRFTTNKFDIKTPNIADGETSSPVKKLTLPFTNVVDATTLAKDTDYTISPEPAAFGIGQFSGGDIILGGNYAPDTMYTFTLKAGATVEDAFGKVFTNTEEKVIHWKTAPAVLLSSTTADNTVIQKLVDGQVVGITLTFNSNMDATTFTTDDFTFVNSTGGAVAGLAISTGTAASGQNCSATGVGCQLRVRGNLAAGDYTFTLKKDAQIKDKLGNTYTVPADRVVHITVKDPVPASQCL